MSDTIAQLEGMYMASSDDQHDGPRTVGRTRDTGWQVGVRRTIAMPVGDLWPRLTSSEGARLWLGELSDGALVSGGTYRLRDGCEGEVRVFVPQSHLRVTWRQTAWPRASTIQVRVIPQGGRTLVAFHQEHLPDAQAREERSLVFSAALDELQSLAERG